VVVVIFGDVRGGARRREGNCVAYLIANNCGIWGDIGCRRSTMCCISGIACGGCGCCVVIVIGEVALTVLKRGGSRR